MQTNSQTVAASNRTGAQLNFGGEPWRDQVSVGASDQAQTARIECSPEFLVQVCERLTRDFGYAFATLVAEELAEAARRLTYVFFADRDPRWIWVELTLGVSDTAVPSITSLAVGPSADWHEREIEDLFGISFEGHPRLGDFILHEDWPEGINPMRRSFDARQRLVQRESDPSWQPPTIVSSPGAFAMPVGPVFSDFAESAQFLLETVGEDVVRTIPRFFYKYRGVEKIAEGQPAGRALLLAERFSGTAAFAHALAFCQAVETICGIETPPRARALRTLFAEVERLRHHAATITGICNSTALAVAASQAALIEEDLLRLNAEVARHRYLFALARPGGLGCDLSEAHLRRIEKVAPDAARRLRELHEALRYSNSFLDRLEEVGILPNEAAIAYGVVGPIARASGIAADLRKLCPYGAYEALDFRVPFEPQGDGYARLRILFSEIEQSASIIGQILGAMPPGAVCAAPVPARAGVALAAVEAPSGAAFHWLRLDEQGCVTRYRLTPPSFTNWHAFHLAAENFAFQDFPIILASFGLSNAECDR